MSDEELEHEEDTGSDDFDAFDEAFEEDKVDPEVDPEKDPEKDPEVDPEKDPEKDPEVDPEKDPEKDPEDEDEATKRGKEALKTQEEQAVKDQAEIDQKAEEERTQKIKDDAIRVIPYTTENIKDYSNIINVDELPDTFEIDGVSIDLKEHIKDFPAAIPLAVIAAQKIVKGLITNGYVDTVRGRTEAMGGMSDTVEDLRFDLGVAKALPGVDVDGILDSEGFVEYVKNAPTEKKALLGTHDPKDFALLVNDFLGKTEETEASKAAKEKAKEIDAAAKKKKETEDSIHEDTLRSTKKISSESDAGSDDFDDVFDEITKGDKK